MPHASPIKPDFIVRLGHELRTPLTSILGYTEILRAQALPYMTAEHQRQLEIIERSGHAMLRLISAVVDWSRLESGLEPCAPQVFNVAELFGTFIDTLAFAASAKGLGFSLQVNPESETDFVTDPDLLRQIVSNLASNAIKFTEHGSITIEVNCTPEELHFAVADTGPGIAQADQARAFEEFERLGTKVKDGTGLGLSIVRGITERLGGAIVLTSEFGAGCRFDVRLPRLEAPTPEAAPPALPLPAEQPRVSVLVVDDEPDNRELLRQLLESEGWEVETCASGEECLLALDRVRPGVVLLDMAMPDIDGFETARRIRQRPSTRSVPIIAITALSGSEIELRTLAAGCSLCVTKPFDFRQLTTAIQRCLPTAQKVRP